MTNEPSPRPWRVHDFYRDGYPVLRDARDTHIATINGCFDMHENGANAALIVGAVNERDDLVENLKTAYANRERENAVWASLVTELKADRDRALKFAEAAPHPGSAPWKEMQAVYAERDRLRDLVKRMAKIIGEAPIDWFGESFVDTQVLLREARAAIGEEEE